MVVNQEIAAVEANIASRLSATAEIALRMLPRMIVRDGPDSGLFCQKIKVDERGGGVMVQEGVSVRYSLMALIGLCAAFGGEVLESQPWISAADRIWRLFSEDRLQHPELGLLLWLDSYRNGASSAKILNALNQHWDAERKYAGTMEVAWILTGLARSNAPAARALAPKVLDFLTAAFNADTHVFALDGNRSAFPWTRNRMNSRLGSFASQVYPIVALAQWVETHCDARISEILRNASEKMCQLQGPSGEWWWIFDVRTGTVFLDYPVYSVHQDAMGPMALLAAGRALQTKDYLPAIARGLEYLFEYRNQRGGDGFINQDGSVIWRAVVRDVPGEDPADTPFGLGAAETKRMRSTGRPLRDAPPLASEFRVLKEARPYCPGWILLAYSQASELFGRSLNLKLPKFESSAENFES